MCSCWISVSQPIFISFEFSWRRMACDVCASISADFLQWQNRNFTGLFSNKIGTLLCVVWQLMLSEDDPASETSIVNPLWGFIATSSSTCPWRSLVYFQIWSKVKCLFCLNVRHVLCKERATGQYTVSKSIGRCVHVVCLHLKIMHVWILSMYRLTASNYSSNNWGRPLSELESFGTISRSVAAWSGFLLPGHGSQSLVWMTPSAIGFCL